MTRPAIIAVMTILSVRCNDHYAAHYTETRHVVIQGPSNGQTERVQGSWTNGLAVHPVGKAFLAINTSNDSYSRSFSLSNGHHIHSFPPLITNQSFHRIASSHSIVNALTPN